MTAAAGSGRTWIGVGSMAAAVFSFTVLDSLAKAAVQTAPTVQVVWGRYAFSLVLLLAIVPRIGLRTLVRTNRMLFQVTRALLLVMATASMFMAVRFLPLTDIYALSFASPIFVAVMAGPLLGERVRGVQWVAVMCGFIGVLVVIRPGVGPISGAAVFPLLMALSYAGYQIMTRRLSATDAPLPILFFTMAVGTLVMTVLVPFGWASLPWSTWLLLILMGLVGLVGQLLLINALAAAPAALLSPLAYTQVIWAILIGYFIFGDIPDAVTLIGGAIVIASGLVVLQSRTSRN